MSAEIDLSMDDDVETYSPHFDAGMTITDGRASYWIRTRVEGYTPNDKGGQDRHVSDQVVDVSAEVWRDAVALLRVTELRHLRAVLKEATDPSVQGTLAAEIGRIASNTVE